MPPSSKHVFRLNSNAAPADDNLTETSVTHQLSNLFDKHSCNICHAVLFAPVKLPCHHIFCSECIRRLLTVQSTCPHPHCARPSTSKDLTPLPLLDIALKPIRQAASTNANATTTTNINSHNIRYLVLLSAKETGARALLTDKLRSVGLPFQGNVTILADRYNEFVIKWNANIDSATPVSKQAIADAVMKQIDIAKSRSLKKNIGNSSGMSFFKKAVTNRAVVGSEQQIESDTVAEGDDFDTLIRKTRARTMWQKRERELELKEILHKEKKMRLDDNHVSNPPTDTSASSVPALKCSSCGHVSNAGVFHTVKSSICSLDIAPTVRKDGNVEVGKSSSSYSIPLKKVPHVAAISLATPTKRQPISIPPQASINQIPQKSLFPGWSRDSTPTQTPTKSTASGQVSITTSPSPCRRPPTSLFNNNVSPQQSSSESQARGAMEDVNHSAPFVYVPTSNHGFAQDYRSQHHISMQSHSQFESHQISVHAKAPTQTAMHVDDTACSTLTVVHNQQHQAQQQSQQEKSQQQQQPLSEEVLRRIQRNRETAIERKKRFYERQRLQQPQPQSKPQSQSQSFSQSMGTQQ